MNLQIREITDNEVFETAVIYIECWQNDYAGIVPEHVLQKFDPEEEAAECREWLATEPSSKIFAAFADGQMVGYIAFSRNTEEPLEYEMEVNGFFVRNEYRNYGIGLRLLHQTGKYLQEKGFSSVVFYNFKESKSNQYYRSLNGQVVKQVTQQCGGKSLEVEVFGWKFDDLLTTLEHKLHKYYV